MIIAVDGPAGAGKSTVARALAQRLGYTYLDSGAMYRCVALAVLDGSGTATAAAAQAQIELGERVLLDGSDVTEAIRKPEVTEQASLVATDPQVRELLVGRQRALLEGGDWVAEGRDVGTVVAPEADLKVFLTASPEIRAERRAAQLGAATAQILAEQTVRDQRDEQREHSPLKAASDAVEVDTSDLTLEQVVDRIVELVPVR